MSLWRFNNELDRRQEGLIDSGPSRVAKGTPFRPLRRWRLLARQFSRKINRSRVTTPVHREGHPDRDVRPSAVKGDADSRRRELQQFLAPHALWPVRQTGPRRR